jgi:DDB1- and CUL4-associated factor 15
MIKKRLTLKSDEESDGDDRDRFRREKKIKNQNILMKILNRESTGFFNQSQRSRCNNKELNRDTTLKICLKDIIPFRYLNDHIFMGLSSCGNFLISYRRKCSEVDSFDLNAVFKYELFFWIFRPHYPLSKYVSQIFLLNT